MRVWSVNSNSNEDNGNPNGFLFMLRQNRVATFYERTEDVANIDAGDLVLLYHNNNRIIAVGFAVQNPSHDFVDLRSIENWVDVNWIWKATFENFEPVNSINRHDLGFTSVRRAVNEITSEIELTSLLREIGVRQTSFI